MGLNPSDWSDTTLEGAQAGQGHWLTRQKRRTEVSALSCLGLGFQRGELWLTADTAPVWVSKGYMCILVSLEQACR